MKDIKSINFSKTTKFIEKIYANEEDFESKLEEYINFKDFTQKSVLGIDIYQYSDYKLKEQTMIPLLFKLLYLETIKFCLEVNKFLFQTYEKSTIEKHFISTGDGGFQIFDTPLHNIIFAIGFASTVRAYNAFQLFENLRGLIGEINLRYSLTYDDIFSFDKNFYGPAIINNARILSKDSLNRCLLDENTYQWFLRKMRGIETIQRLNLDDINNIEDFHEYDKSFLDDDNLIFSKNKTSITATDLLKIGTIKAKKSEISIYNLHLQVFLIYVKEKNKLKYAITLGNLNTSGIT